MLLFGSARSSVAMRAPVDDLDLMVSYRWRSTSVGYEANAMPRLFAFVEVKNAQSGFIYRPITRMRLRLKEERLAVSGS
jgi:hypothetical protein